MNNNFLSKIFISLGILCITLSFLGITTASASLSYWLSPVDLTAPPVAIKTYLYGSPVYPVPQENLHRATYTLDTDTVLNYYAFYFDVPERGYPIGTDESGQFVMIMVASTGQVGWVPIIEAVEAGTKPMKVFKMNNMPDYFNRYK